MGFSDGFMRFSCDLIGVIQWKIMDHLMGYITNQQSTLQRWCPPCSESLSCLKLPWLSVGFIVMK